MTSAAQRPDALWAAVIWGVDVGPVFTPIQQTAAVVTRIGVGQLVIDLGEGIDATAVIPTVYLYEFGAQGQARAFTGPITDSQWVVLTFDVVAGVPQLVDASVAWMLTRTAEGIDLVP